MNANKIEGFWVVEASKEARQEMSNGAPLATYYGYDKAGQVITIDGVVLQGTEEVAGTVAQEFADVWAEQGVDMEYTYRPLTEEDDFGGYQNAVDIMVLAAK